MHDLLPKRTDADYGGTNGSRSGGGRRGGLVGAVDVVGLQ